MIEAWQIPYLVALIVAGFLVIAVPCYIWGYHTAIKHTEDTNTSKGKNEN